MRPSCLGNALRGELLRTHERAVHPAPVITLHTFPGRWGLESLSPFCMKVEVYLKLAKLPYKTTLGDPRKAPKGKMPFIEDDGTIVCDSTAILDYLEKKHGAPIDGGLSELDRARGHMIRRTFEEALYFVALWVRWSEEAGWKETQKVFDMIPGAIRWAVAPMIRRKVIQTAHAQGTARHSRDEIYELGKRDLEAFATILGDRRYVLDDRLRTTDIVAYSFLANVLRPDIETPLKDAAKALPSLDKYITHIAADVEKAVSATAKAAE
jgi:glutathione S-transferase